MWRSTLPKGLAGGCGALHARVTREPTLCSTKRGSALLSQQLCCDYFLEMDLAWAMKEKSTKLEGEGVNGKANLKSSLFFQV